VLKILGALSDIYGEDTDAVDEKPLVRKSA
jgi:hypothetical protein